MKFRIIFRRVKNKLLYLSKSIFLHEAIGYEEIMRQLGTPEQRVIAFIPYSEQACDETGKKRLQQYLD